MVKLLTIMLTISLAGCAATPVRVASRDPETILANARMALEEDQLYIAKSEVERVLEMRPGSEEAEWLMAEIIDREIVRQMTAEDIKAFEEFSDQDKQDEVRTWLERAQTLSEIKMYDEAVLAAEKVFLFDPDNREASRLIDETKKSAIADGKEQSLVLKKMYQSEIDIRVETYNEQGQIWLAAGRMGAARLAVEKILLLDPENSVALQMHKEIKNNQKKSQA